MSDLLDKNNNISALLKRATDSLFALNRIGTSMGILFGIVLEGIIKIFDPLLKNQQTVDFKRINTIYYILFGVFLFNLPHLFRRPRLDPQIELALAAISKAKREQHIS